MTQYKDKLYIKDQLGKIREWYILYTHDRYSKNYGILNGETIQSVIEIKEGKNIGKSNETSISQQVLKECESEYKHQLKLGYKSANMILPINRLSYEIDLYKKLDVVLSSSKTDENDYLKPMKAQKYEIDCMQFPVFVQPKINGVRATIKLVEKQNGLFGTYWKAEIKSKEGLIYNIPHLELQAEILLEQYKEIVLDGEIYISGEHVTSIGGAARNINNPLNKKLGFICFDLSIANLSQAERIKLKNEIFINIDFYLTPTFLYANKVKDLHSTIINCPTNICDSEEKLLDMTNKYLESDFEGAIIRDMNAEYKFGSRAKTMRKCKRFDDAEFKIVDIVAGEKDGKSIFICKNDVNDLTFRVDGTAQYLDPDYIKYKQKYIGSLATVKFYERTINNLPFHTTLIGIRDYEQ